MIMTMAKKNLADFEVICAIKGRVKESMGNRFFEFCKKKRQISPKNGMDYNYGVLGPFWSKKKVETFFDPSFVSGTPLPEKIG